MLVIVRVINYFKNVRSNIYTEKKLFKTLIIGVSDLQLELVFKTWYLVQSNCVFTVKTNFFSTSDQYNFWDWINVVF